MQEATRDSHAGVLFKDWTIPLEVRLGTVRWCGAMEGVSVDTANGRRWLPVRPIRKERRINCDNPRVPSAGWPTFALNPKP